MLAATRYKNGRICVWDSDDGSEGWYSPEKLANIIQKTGIVIDGVCYDKDSNPMFTIAGLQVNLYYRQSILLDKFRVAFLPKGDRWGSTFSSEVKEHSVAVFDSDTTLDPHVYPSGQYIATYYARTMLQTTSGLVLEASVPSWRLTAEEVEQVKAWLEVQIMREERKK